MFDKKVFSDILKKIYKTYKNQREFGEATGRNRTYLSKYMNLKLDNPPSPKILRGIANASKGITTYEELMRVCGYKEKVIRNGMEQGAIEYLEELVRTEKPGYSLISIVLNYIKKLEGDG